MKRTRLIAVLFMMISAFGITPASAHTRLISSTPDANSTIQKWPAKILLRFDENLTTLSTKPVNWIIVRDSLGHQLDSGSTQVSGSLASVNTKANAQRGKFTIQYRVISNDGHVVTNKFTFTFSK